ncbi:hypothetical protein MXB_5210, partial [Myxobolus squamalis]
MSELEDEVTRGWLNEAPSPPALSRLQSNYSVYKRKIFVGFFRKNLIESQLRDYFSSFGTIEKVQMLRDGFGVSRGYAFVSFTDESAVDTILANKPHVMLGIQLETRRAFPKDSPSTIHNSNHSMNKIFIGGLPKTVTKQDISNFFEYTYSNSPLLKIENICIPVDSMGRTKGFAFVLFSNEDIVDKILYEHSRTEICGRNCEIKRAELREEDISAAPQTQPSVVHNRKQRTHDESNTLHLLSTENGESSSHLMGGGAEKIRKMNLNLNGNPLLNPINSEPNENLICEPLEVISALKRPLGKRIESEMP